MIDGKHWPIPKKKLIDGSNLSIKNSNKLLDLANEQFKKDEPEYGISIYLAVIAIEELGKAILLSEFSEDSAAAISKDFWNKNLEHHKPKIKAAVDHIRKFIEINDPRRSEKLASLK
jgi:AbiV family abortive infection protein